ncbi:MAG TPA: SufE family protein [Cyclobacteriaceae bacterium]
MAIQEINKIQDEIIEEFTLFDGDLEMAVNYIIELGDKLPEMEGQKKVEDNIVKGCQSKVWLTADLNDGKVKYEADSNTSVTKGLVSLLVRTLSDQKPEDILDADIYFPMKIGMNRFIGTQRSNGFASMIKQMKIYSLALNEKSKTDA